MDKEKALQIIKQTIDHAVASGLFKNVESVMTITQALNTIMNNLDIKKD